MKNKNIYYIILALFAVLTFCLMLQRAPFWDEANSWMIAKSFSIPELFQVSKYDGHLFIWFLLQMPFAKNNLFYPYSIYILNWLSCMAALFVFWKKSPFTIVEKSLITFSFPFFWYFSQAARCYSLGIFILFLISTLWQKRKEKTVLIALLIVFAANTSPMALVGASAFGSILLFEKNKKSIAILAVGALLVLLQLKGASVPGTVFPETFLERLIGFFFLFQFDSAYSILVKIFALTLFFGFFISVAVFWKEKRTLFFFLASIIALFSIFCFKYQGSWWNYLFFYVYFIISVWLYRMEFGKSGKTLNLIFFMITVLLCEKRCFLNVIGRIWSMMGKEAKFIKF